MTLFDRLTLWLRGAAPPVHEQLRRRMRAAARTAIASSRDDAPSRIVGVARGTSTIVAPLSGQRCLAYHLAFAGGEEIRRVAFVVEDASGIVEVAPQDVWLTLDHRTPWFRGPPTGLPPAVRDAMSRAGRTTFVLGAGIETWASEGRIEPGDRVAVVGTIDRSPAPAILGDYRQAAGHVYRLVGTGDAPIMVSNAPETMA